MQEQERLWQLALGRRRPRAEPPTHAAPQLSPSLPLWPQARTVNSRGCPLPLVDNHEGETDLPYSDGRGGVGCRSMCQPIGIFAIKYAKMYVFSKEFHVSSYISHFMAYCIAITIGEPCRIGFSKASMRNRSLGLRPRERITHLGLGKTDATRHHSTEVYIPLCNFQLIELELLIRNRTIWCSYVLLELCPFCLASQKRRELIFLYLCPRYTMYGFMCSFAKQAYALASFGLSHTTAHEHEWLV